MALKSKLLDEKVVESARKMLKEVRNNAYVAKKLNAVIAAKSTSCSKNMLHFKECNNFMDEALKIWKRKQTICTASTPSILNQSQRNQIEMWIEENPNITIKEAKIRILEELGLNISKSTVHRHMQKMKFSYITPRPVHNGQDKSR